MNSEIIEFKFGRILWPKNDSTECVVFNFLNIWSKFESNLILGVNNLKFNFRRIRSPENEFSLVNSMQCPSHPWSNMESSPTHGF